MRPKASRSRPKGDKSKEMHISRISVHSFRSINDAEIPIGKITALVGENNAGKSSLLRALNAFFNFKEESQFFADGKHAYSNYSKPKVEIIFEDIPNDQQLLHLTQNGNMHIEFTCKNGTDKPIYRYKSNNRFNALDVSTFEKIKKHIDFVLIPPSRDLNKLKWTENALLKELVEVFLQNATKSRDVLSSPFLKATRDIERNALTKIAKKIQSAYATHHNYNFSLRYNTNISYSDFLTNIQFLLKEKTGEFDLVDCGTGIQSLSIIAMYRVLSELKHKNVVIGLEEPETNLHPQAQREFIRDLSSRTGTDNCCQAIFTTHSTVIIDQLQHEQIVLFRKVADEHRQCGFRTEANYITDSFWDKYGLDEFKYYQFHRYKNSEMFFAKYAIIVESKNDAQVIQKIVSDSGYQIDMAGISIINLDGVDNIKYPYYLLKELSIPFLTIVDKEYFLPYQNDSLDNSRDSNGFPKYKNEYKPDSLINEMIPNPRDRDNLLEYLRSNHTKALDLLLRHRVICMKHSLEIDLISSAKGCELFYSRLRIPPVRQNQHELLVANKDTIKKIGNILEVLKQMPPTSLPLSYSRIKHAIIEIIKVIS